MSAEDFGLKVSLPGFDVKTATPEQCSVHSSYPPFKAKVNQTSPHFALVDVDFTGTVPQTVTHTLYSISHGYSYTPFNLPSMEFTDSLGAQFSGIGNISVGATLDINAYIVGSEFKITIFDDAAWTGPIARLRVSYYIFAENGV